MTFDGIMELTESRQRNMKNMQKEFFDRINKINRIVRGDDG